MKPKVDMLNLMKNMVNANAKEEKSEGKSKKGSKKKGSKKKGC